ncbi:ABC transporter ATP-binding protein [Cellulomonas sp.]|uniref:ABC transporter ATP-binding protein n=1 Tax=Cellulomonas sp. TaxID=40001 RepID=UPI002586866C|nr:ABC transporter ATP-binding protein [Cellulomonas sp.]MCR6688361.1 ABC transporter ATP-binding protein [Cellulomonas sp.]
MTGGLVVDARVERDGFSLDVRLRAAPGEVLAVLGPNGAGKSTLLGAIAGLTSVTSGRIVLDGHVLDDADAGVFVETAHRPVGLVFQDYRLFPYLTVLDNVAFAARARGAGRARSRAQAQVWIDRLGLTELAARRPRDLSGGQAQRTALARALAAAPAALLLDEPLAALDARTRLDVQAELKRHLAQFAGPSLVVTHDPVDALVLADRLVVLEDGQVVQDAAPADVARRPATGYVAKLVGLNLYRGAADGDEVRLDGGGTLTVPDHGERGAVLVSIRPSAVVVSTHRPGTTSARNVWPATVVGLTMLTDRVRLDLAGHPSALVDVTPAAVAELGIAPGDGLWLSVKATEIEVYPQP